MAMDVGAGRKGRARRNIRIRHGSVEGLRRGPEAEAILQCTQSIQGIIQSLIFFDRVGAGRKQFTCPGYNRALSIGDSSRDLFFVGLEEGCDVELPPMRKLKLGD